MNLYIEKKIRCRTLKDAAFIRFLDIKRGVSPVVATVLIVLLTVILTGIIAIMVKNFTEKSIEESAKCYLYRDYFKFEESFGLTCINISEGNITSFSLQAGRVSEDLPAPLIGLNVVLKNPGISNVKKIRIGENSSQALEGIWRPDEPFQNLVIPNQGEIVTYSYNTTMIYREIEVYPVIEGEQICPITDSISLHLCGGSA